MSRIMNVAVVTLLALAATAGSGEAQKPKAKTVVVKMVDKSATSYTFESSSIVVQLGDTIRFEQTGPMPHNVSFKNPPATAKLGEAMMGPFLSTAGESYTLVIDSRFVAGEYEFFCMPHETLGMKGTITVGKTGKSTAAK